MKKINLLLLFLGLSVSVLKAQDITQVLRGKIVDSESTNPIIGATIELVGTSPLQGTSTDVDGYFKILNVKIGRISLKISSLGYETIYINDVLITAGKEKVLDLRMIESFTKINEVVVKARKSATRVKNEMASISSKSFTVNETERYAANGEDPARMVAAFAGVNNAGSDLANDISIRGNSPKGLLWRMEGIEIPNPNHFASNGGSGGIVSMLNTNTMSNSDFYTGAFPAEFGNATSGVFDLYLRNGNNETHEFSFKYSSIGLMASAEGPFSKKSKASYLLNYRYSTTKIIALFAPSLFRGYVPEYQDVTIKVNIPTKKIGTFTLFGLGGLNGVDKKAIADSSKWEISDDKYNVFLQSITGFVGLKHSIILSSKTYLKTIALASINQYNKKASVLNVNKNYNVVPRQNTKFQDYSYKLSVLLNHKFNSKSTLRVGAIESFLPFSYKRDIKIDSIYGSDTSQVWKNIYNSKGNTFFTQAYGQWKYRINEKFTLNTGVHFSFLTFNNSWAIDPRASIEYKIAKASSISLAAGIHSKPDHISTYLISRKDNNGNKYFPNKELKFTKSAQIVLGYKQKLFNFLELDVEPYFQYQFDVPVGSERNSRFSTVNSKDLWTIIDGPDSLVSNGTGLNYGIDFTLQKPLGKQYYFMLTASLYESKYKTMNGKLFNTFYNGNYSLNILAGKEFKIGKRKRNIIGFNAKFILKGGNRFTPINLEASKTVNKEILYEERSYESQYNPYYKVDFEFTYKINSKNITHSINIGTQNITNNRKNINSTYYDNETRKIEETHQLGILPFMGYKIEFKTKSKR